MRPRKPPLPTGDDLGKRARELGVSIREDELKILNTDTMFGEAEPELQRRVMEAERHASQMRTARWTVIASLVSALSSAVAAAAAWWVIIHRPQ